MEPPLTEAALNALHAFHLFWWGVGDHFVQKGCYIAHHVKKRPEYSHLRITPRAKFLGLTGSAAGVHTPRLGCGAPALVGIDRHLPVLAVLPLALPAFRDPSPLYMFDSHGWSC